MITILLCIVLGVLLVILLCGGIIGISFLSKYSFITMKIQERKLNGEFTDSIKTINGILDLIDKSVALKTAHAVKESIVLNKPYNPINLDKDCKKIADEIFNEFNQELFLNFNKVNHIYTEKFWMNYIIKKTTIMMLDFTSTIYQ